MQAIRMQCEVSPDRTITVQLPDHVEPGVHELVLVFDRSAYRREVSDNAQDLMRMSGSVPSFAHVDGVAWQRSLRDEEGAVEWRNRP